MSKEVFYAIGIQANLIIHVPIGKGHLKTLENYLKMNQSFISYIISLRYKLLLLFMSVFNYFLIGQGLGIKLN